MKECLFFKSSYLPNVAGLRGATEVKSNCCIADQYGYPVKRFCCTAFDTYAWVDYHNNYLDGNVR